MECPRYEVLSDRTNERTTPFLWRFGRGTKTFVIQALKTVLWGPWVFVQLLTRRLSREAERAAMVSLALTIFGELMMDLYMQLSIAPDPEATGYAVMAVFYLVMGIIVRLTSRELRFHLVE